jgi:hypothetical protein
MELDSKLLILVLIDRAQAINYLHGTDREPDSHLIPVLQIQSFLQTSHTGTNRWMTRLLSSHTVIDSEREPVSKLLLS